jgi:hypothetical protein
MGYFRLLALSAVVSFGLVWAWVVAMPMGFMDPEFASWRAKQVMLQRCDLGEAIIVGDSRAAAGILPNRLPFVTTNLAVGGGEAIEAYVALARALACPKQPKLVIISIDPGHFSQADLFWDRSVRFGWLSHAEIVGLREASYRTGDLTIYQSRRMDGVPLWLRDALYGVRFPPLYFGSLAHGAGMRRWAGNHAILAETLTSRGQYYFGRQPGSDVVAVDGHMDAFRPLPVLDDYFGRLLEMLDAHGIDSRFVAMPVNEATWQQVHPRVREDFAAYLGGYERRHAQFRVMAEVMTHWPDRFFGDEFCHLNPEGAALFSAELAQRLQEVPPSTQNEAQNGWLRETGRDASAKVVPISKRGS